MTTILHIYDRGAITSRAWAIASLRREKTAQREHEASAEIVAGRRVHLRRLEQCRAAIPLDRAGALRQAWAEARQGSEAATPRKQPEPLKKAPIVVSRPGALAPLRRLRMGPAVRLLAVALRWIGSRYIPQRAA
jgi:hypothetical protein